MTSVALGGCFGGAFLAGQPCLADADCGPKLRCEVGRCGGVRGETTGTTSDAGPTTETTATPTEELPLPTTDLTTGDGSSTTAPVEPSTGTTTSPSQTTGEAPGTSSTGDDPDTTTGPSCGLGQCSNIDILFVIDNSRSMSGKGDTYAALMLSAIDTLFPVFDTLCSVHLGFITTDEYANNPEECRKLGALVQADTDGNPCVYHEGHPYATLADFNDLPAIACAAVVGTDGDSNERQIDAILASFLLNDQCNGGFHRPDATLVVILLTDEDDGSPDPQGHSGSDNIPPNFWPNAVQVAKKDQAFYFGAVLGDVDQEATACPWQPLVGADGSGASPAPGLRTFLTALGPAKHAVASICQPEPDPENFVPFMSEVLTDLGTICDAE